MDFRRAYSDIRNLPTGIRQNGIEWFTRDLPPTLGGAGTTLSAAGNSISLLRSGSLFAAETVAPKVGIQANKAAGDAIRDVIAAREAPALIEQSFTTVGGVRRVDVLKLGDETLAIESKVGRTFLRARERQELARDWWLQRQGQVGGVRWEFSPSGVNGGVGPTQELQRMCNSQVPPARASPG